MTAVPEAGDRACPLCGSRDAAPWAPYSPDPWQVVQCASCELTYLRNPVDYERLHEEFAWEKTYAEKKKKGGSTKASGAVRNFRKALGIYDRPKTDRFVRWFGAGNVLDIGCGHGERLVEPITPFGIELSHALHAQADATMRARGGRCVLGAGAEAIWDFDEGQFDGILMNSYLEHETDMMGVLRGAHRALKDTGRIFIRVPNFGSINRRVIGKNWCGFRYPDHVNYFTKATLTETARRAGFDLSIVNRANLALDDNIQALLRKSGTPSAPAVAPST